MFNNNPIPITSHISDPRINIRENPDPFMICHEGRYYCYSTGLHGVNVLRSDDLESFEHMGFALHDANYYAYWAPAVIFRDGLFYMYYSCLPAGEEDAHQEFLRVATATDPLGPFVCQKVLFDEFSIDAHVVEKDGGLYLFYSANIYDSADDKIGTVTLLDKMLDPYTPQGAPRVVVGPSIDQEIHMRNRDGDGRDWYTIEGGFYFERGGIGFLMYSANAWTQADYFVGYATCDANMPLDEAVFTKYPGPDVYQPLIGKDDYFTGCGHNSMITGPNGDLCIVYHGRPRNEKVEEDGGGRRLCISRVVVEGERLVLLPRE